MNRTVIVEDHARGSTVACVGQGVVGKNPWVILRHSERRDYLIPQFGGKIRRRKEVELRKTRLVECMGKNEKKIT